MVCISINCEVLWKVFGEPWNDILLIALIHPPQSKEIISSEFKLNSQICNLNYIVFCNTIADETKPFGTVKPL